MIKLNDFCFNVPHAAAADVCVCHEKLIFHEFALIAIRRVVQLVTLLEFVRTFPPEKG